MSANMEHVNEHDLINERFKSESEARRETTTRIYSDMREVLKVGNDGFTLLSGEIHKLYALVGVSCGISVMALLTVIANAV